MKYKYSEEVREAMKQLIIDYQAQLNGKLSKLWECPLCRHFDIGCYKCPWIIETGKRCFKQGWAYDTGLMRAADKDIPKHVLTWWRKKRIKELLEWTNKKI